MNILETLADTFESFHEGGEKPPLHIGEAMNLWFYLSATEQTLRGEQVSRNTVRDADLKAKLEDVIRNVHTPIRDELRAFLQAEGVALPQITPEKAAGEFRDIPEDAKLNDEEVANLVSFNIVLGVTYACRGMTEAVRPDVAEMFARFQMKKMAFAVRLRQMLLKKGLLLVPPYIRPGQ